MGSWRKFYSSFHRASNLAPSEHYFLISIRTALVQPGWLYFRFFLQLNFQFVQKRKNLGPSLKPITNLPVS